MLVALAVAVLLLAITSTYSSWQAANAHHNSCNSRGLIVDAIHDVIVRAVTPDPKQVLTVTQVKRIQSFENYSFARLDRALC